MSTTDNLIAQIDQHASQLHRRPGKCAHWEIKRSGSGAWHTIVFTVPLPIDEDWTTHFPESGFSAIETTGDNFTEVLSTTAVRVMLAVYAINPHEEATA